MNRTLSESLERTLARLVDVSTRVARDALVASMLLPAVTGFGGCRAPEAATPAPGDGTKVSALSDWVHDQGTRNTAMVGYTGSWWTQNTDCGERGGCQGVDVFVKVRVQRVDGANLDNKHVGIYCAAPFCPTAGQTANGTYFGDLGNGQEEWHVPVSRRMWDVGGFTFTAWYQDGAGNTYFDDNEGEQHAVAYRGTPVMIRHDWGATSISVGDDGVKGKVSMILASLDYDKDVRMVWTTDAWATVNEFKAGDGDNLWKYKEDAGGGFERWEINLSIAGPVSRFEYAVLYRHGVVGAAQHYDFWDSNGGLNHVYVKGAYPMPPPS